ncbi:MAG TPA: hypothetical protein VKH63_22130 [Candidatus Acidoferrum sp.]|jgi:hypothetical protein|nr:hypothetical protein [Candidatus Acidoferrum sp.]
MIPVEFSRRVAIELLRFAIWIAPHDTHEWGQGMLSELNHVEGNWSALLWSLGGAGVLAKHAIIAAIFPGTQRRTVSTAIALTTRSRLRNNFVRSRPSHRRRSPYANAPADQRPSLVGAGLAPPISAAHYSPPTTHCLSRASPRP